MGRADRMVMNIDGTITHSAFVQQAFTDSDGNGQKDAVAAKPDWTEGCRVFPGCCGRLGPPVRLEARASLLMKLSQEEEEKRVTMACWGGRGRPQTG